MTTIALSAEYKDRVTGKSRGKVSGGSIKFLHQCENIRIIEFSVEQLGASAEEGEAMRRFSQSAGSPPAVGQRGISIRGFTNTPWAELALERCS
jgi:hypothetical protein